MRTRTAALAAIVAVTLALAVGTVPAAASPLSARRQQAAEAKARIAASQARVTASAHDYAAAEDRLATIQKRAAANSSKLDSLVARQQELQTRLAGRAADMYRRGPFAFVEVLAGAVSFDQFTSVWDMLTEISSSDAQMVIELKQTRAEAVAAARALSAQQGQASGQLRALDAARARAKTELGSDRAAYASYQSQVTALEAAQAPKPPAGIVAVRSSSSGGSSSSHTPGPDQSQKGSGAWRSALCSMYGASDIGSGMAGGGTVQADSMIVAHKTLPFGTVIEFEYHGRTGVATVQDRGPYTGGREFDLGPGLARVLGFDGVGNVNYRIIGR
jgi:peptidoglycan hydrolase CwlO-like protein